MDIRCAVYRDRHGGKNWQLPCLFSCNLVNSITVDGMTAFSSQTVLNLILVTHGIVLPILWIVGVQFTETLTEVKIGYYLVC